MAKALQTLAKWAIPVGLAAGGIQSAMYDGKLLILFLIE
jgi:prohibitin 1